VVLGDDEDLRATLQGGQRVTVDLSDLTIRGVRCSQNVQKALGTILAQTCDKPPTRRNELRFSFKGVKRVGVPDERIRPA